jgi:3-dehydroquinate dehydratase/shikimate dehydrogenase
MLTAIIKGPTFSKAQEEIEQALPYADLLEMRLDCFSEFSVHSLDLFRRSLPLPVIFTLRKKTDGGECCLQGSERLQQIKRLMMLKPDYFDIESEEGEELFLTLKKHYPQVQLIASHHDFQQMPKDFFSLLDSMPKKGVDIHKIAAMAPSSLDALRMLQFLKKTRGKVVGLAMGEKGQFARILSPIFGNRMIYGYAVRKGEEGQPSLQELRKIYHTSQLNQNTSIYALLGGNVERSRGHLFHNEFFRASEKNAIYVKIALEEDELGPFLRYAKDLFFQGMSVTMPLK